MLVRHSPEGSVLEAIVSWWVGLLTIALIARLALISGGGGDWSSWETGRAVVSRLSTLLPFAVFAGGLAAGSPSAGWIRQVRTLLAVALPLIALSYAGRTFVAPELEYRASAARGDDLDVRFPFGAETPFALAEQRAFINADPPASFRLSVERPLEQPPNWLTYRIHFPIVFAVFGIVNALLGLVVGLLTSGLDPPVRRQARWALGLACAIAFFAPASLAGAWVRSSVTHSAMIGVWAPLAVPVLGIMIALAVQVTSERSFTERPDVFEP